MLMFKRFTPMAAFLITLGATLVTVPAEARGAQDGREARLAAAHAAIDPELERTFNFEVMRASLTIDGLDPQEQTAIYEAAQSLSPQIIRGAQNIVAEVMADGLSLSQLQTPDTITEAQFATLYQAADARLSALGARFAYDAVTRGCRVKSEPSAICRVLLDSPAPPIP
jgi:hypothetical protein